MSSRTRRRRFPALAYLKMVPLPGHFVRHAPDQLPSQLAPRVTRVAAGWRGRDPERKRQNLGEIATILMARSCGAAVITDDTAARDWAAEQQVTTYTTRDVAATMTRAR